MVVQVGERALVRCGQCCVIIQMITSISDLRSLLVDGCTEPCWSCCVLGCTTHQITLEVTMVEHEKPLCIISETGGKWYLVAVAYLTLTLMQIGMQHVSLV